MKPMIKPYDSIALPQYSSYWKELNFPKKIAPVAFRRCRLWTIMYILWHSTIIFKYTRIANEQCFNDDDDYYIVIAVSWNPIVRLNHRIYMYIIYFESEKYFVRSNNIFSCTNTMRSEKLVH